MKEMPKRIEEYYKVRLHARLTRSLPPFRWDIRATSVASWRLLTSRMVRSLCCVVSQVQRSLRSHDTQYSRIMDDADAADGQGKKAKKAAQAVRTLEANTAAA